MKTAMEKFFEKYKQWSHGTFGTDKPEHGLTKLLKETNEAIEQPHDITEYADCLMCILYAYSCAFPDYTLDELLQAANEKLEVNIARKWIRQPDGTWQHDKSQPLQNHLQ